MLLAMASIIWRVYMYIRRRSDYSQKRKDIYTHLSHVQQPNRMATAAKERDGGIHSSSGGDIGAAACKHFLRVAMVFLLVRHAFARLLPFAHIHICQGMGLYTNVPTAGG